jgi:hypothetical protein
MEKFRSKLQPSMVANPNVDIQPIDIKKRYIVLPYVSRKCETFAVNLKKLVEDNFNKVEFNVAFKAPKTIGNYFPFKDRIASKEAESLVVYKVTCETCQAIYIGKTERILHYRMREHMSNSKLNKSAVYDHIKKNPDHVINMDNIEIIDRASNNFKVQVKELLHILKCKPILNTQLNSQSSYNIKTHIIKAYPMGNAN